MKVKVVSGDSSFVHKRILLNTGRSKVESALVPHVSGEASHAAFHVVIRQPIILALFPEVFVAFLCTGALAWAQSMPEEHRGALTPL